MQKVGLVVLAASVLFLAGCSTQPKTWQAPVTKITEKGSPDYTVRRGDTIYGIANGFGIPVRQLVESNHLKWPYQLYIGQKITLRKSNVIDRAVTTVHEPATIQPMHHARAVETSPNVTRPVFETHKTTQLAARRAPARPVPPKRPVKLTPPSRPAKVMTKPANPPEHVNLPPGPKPIPKVKPVEVAPAVSSAGWMWPAKGSVTPVPNGGVSIATTNGQNVVAANDGSVVYTGPDVNGSGKLVIVSHKDSMLSAYGNLSQVSVSEGSKLSRGQLLGKASDSLHFEIRQNGVLAKVSQYLPQRA